MPWGLRPFRNRRFAPINVRSETAHSASSCSMDGGRCLVLADGWYEWLKAEKKGAPRLPFRYTVDGGGPFAFAGVYDGTRRRRSSRPRRTRSAGRSIAGCRSFSRVRGRGGVAERGGGRRRRRSSCWAPLESARVSVAPPTPRSIRRVSKGRSSSSARSLSHAALRHAVLKRSPDGRRTRRPRRSVRCSPPDRRVAARGAAAAARPRARARARHGRSAPTDWAGSTSATIRGLRAAQNAAIMALALILYEGGLSSGWAEIRPVIGVSVLLATVGTAAHGRADRGRRAARCSPS